MRAAERAPFELDDILRGRLDEQPTLRTVDGALDARDILDDSSSTPVRDRAPAGSRAHARRSPHARSAHHRRGRSPPRAPAGGSRRRTGRGPRPRAPPASHPDATGRDARRPPGSRPLVGPHPGRRPPVPGSNRRRPRRAHPPAPTSPQDRLVGRRAGRDEREGRTDDAGVPREQRLGFEDRADLLAGSRRRLDRERLELGRAAVQGVGQSAVLGSRRRGARGRCPRSACHDRRCARRGRRDDQQAPDPHARGAGTSDEDGARHGQLDGTRTGPVSERPRPRRPARATAGPTTSPRDPGAPSIARQDTRPGPSSRASGSWRAPRLRRSRPSPR